MKIEMKITYPYNYSDREENNTHSILQWVSLSQKKNCLKWMSFSIFDPTKRRLYKTYSWEHTQTIEF